MIKKAKSKAIKTAVALEAVQVEACFERAAQIFFCKSG
jgi:hypothetical protein